jgi:tricorn protease-like protein
VIVPFGGSGNSRTFAVPDSVNLSRIAWTPDGKSLLYRDGIQGLWEQRLDETKPQLVKGSEDREIYQFAWSFDGKNLVYSSGMRMQEIILLDGLE